MSSKFADHFSTQAAGYARFRPDYPAALFDWIASVAPARRLAWDCATGNGQAARGLAGRFDAVVATDGSAAQLSAAVAHPRIRYVCATAERSGLREHSADVVTVAQALHWFDLEAFYSEVRRVVVPGGAVVVWTYGMTQVEPRIDALIDELYGGTLGDYWPPGRQHVDEGYARLAFPFARLAPPEFAMEREWTSDELVGYIATWSAVQRLRKAGNGEAFEEFARRVGEAWGPRERTRLVRWPLSVRAGRTDGGA